jgi:hypothetical protein
VFLRFLSSNLSRRSLGLIQVVWGVSSSNLHGLRRCSLVVVLLLVQVEASSSIDFLIRSSSFRSPLIDMPEFTKYTFSLPGRLILSKKKHCINPRASARPCFRLPDIVPRFLATIAGGFSPDRPLLPRPDRSNSKKTHASNQTGISLCLVQRVALD